MDRSRILAIWIMEQPNDIRICLMTSGDKTLLFSPWSCTSTSGGEVAAASFVAPLAVQRHPFRIAISDSRTFILSLSSATSFVKNASHSPIYTTGGYFPIFRRKTSVEISFNLATSVGENIFTPMINFHFDLKKISIFYEFELRKVFKDPFVFQCSIHDIEEFARQGDIGFRTSPPTFD